MFIFSDGTLCSDFMPEKSVIHCFHIIRKEGVPTPIMETEKEKLGSGNFTVRMVRSLERRSLARNGVVISSIVMAYPGTKGTTPAEYAQWAAWLGIKIPKTSSRWRRWSRRTDSAPLWPSFCQAHSLTSPHNCSCCRKSGAGSNC